MANQVRLGCLLPLGINNSQGIEENSRSILRKLPVHRQVKAGV